MCGIAGYFFNRPEKELLLSMVSQLQHRGPDGFGYYIDNKAGLAHSRLSIIDIEGGAQPMTNEVGTIWVTFNGEIYNYRELRNILEHQGHNFKTNSDTEVIVHAYEEFGIDCARAFNGQFAFALWDTHTETGYLVRDRVGIQPLFYGFDERSHRGGVYFGSEVKAILANPNMRNGLSNEEIANVFTYWSPSKGCSVFEGINEVPPGEILAFHTSGRAYQYDEYWDHNYTKRDDHYGLAYHMDNAVDFRLRADVPVAAYLSGGLDSSIIAGLAAQKTENLKTFSISFEDDQYDESEFQHHQAAKIGVDHTTFKCKTSDIARVFPSVIYHAEKPTIRSAPAPMYLLSKLVKDQGIKVVLTGEGADEVFAGYDIFREDFVRREMIRTDDATYINHLLTSLYPWMSEKMLTSSTDYLKLIFGSDDRDTDTGWFSHKPRVNAAGKAAMFFSEGMSPSSPVEYYTSAHNPLRIATNLERSQYLEFKTMFNGYLISTQGDRMLMANGVEGRFPFLDPNVVDFGNSLFPDKKLHVTDRGEMTEKYVLKEYAKMSNLVQKEIINRKKQPYMSPDGVAFLREGAWWYDYVDHAFAQDYGYFNMKRANILKKKVAKGFANGFPENMAFMGILSTQLLHMMLVDGYMPKPTVSEERFQVRVNKIEQ